MPTPDRPDRLPLLVVDGDSLLHRAYHAMPPVTGTGGRPVGALLGFANMLLNVLENEPVRAVAVTLDSRTPGYRSRLHPPYQAQRPAFDAPLVAQLDDVPDFMAAFGIPAPRLDGWEADDVLATLVTRETAGGGSALVLTSDRDAFQLVGPAVTVLRPAGAGRELDRVDRAGVVERYGVLPEQVVDLIALRGDPSDNIPGARGIGAKGAAELLRRYGDLEGVIAHADELGGARAAAVRDAADTLRLYRRVASMALDLPVEPPPDTVPNWAGAAAACRARGINRLAERLEARATS